jgi:hypothetical protein
MGLEITVWPVFGQKLDTQNELGQNEAGQINHLKAGKYYEME